MAQYTVSLKPGHPTGTYRRGGRVFQVGEPQTLTDEELTPVIAGDAWLVVREVKAKPAKAAKAEG